MTKLAEFFNTPMGSAAGRAVGRVFSGVAVVAAMSAAVPAPPANALPISAATRNTPHAVLNFNYQDLMAFDAKLQPLKEQKEAYDAIILTYGLLLLELRAATSDAAEVSPRRQIEIYGSVITDWIETTRAELRSLIEEEEREQEEAEVVDASVGPVQRRDAKARVFEEAYREVAARNVELREATSA